MAIGGTNSMSCLGPDPSRKINIQPAPEDAYAATKRVTEHVPMSVMSLSALEQGRRRGGNLAVAVTLMAWERSGGV